jgi:hypothetical protein
MNGIMALCLEKVWKHFYTRLNMQHIWVYSNEEIVLTISEK